MCRESVLGIMDAQNGVELVHIFVQWHSFKFIVVSALLFYWPLLQIVYFTNDYA